MRPLLVAGKERAAIKAVIEKARAHPVRWEQIKDTAVPPVGNLDLKDRKPGSRPPSPWVLIPFGYRCNFSFEEQPTGMFRHLSISVDTKGKVPSPQAVEMLSEEFGVAFPPKAGTVWTEEFEPGHHAVNIIDLEPSTGTQ